MKLAVLATLFTGVFLAQSASAWIFGSSEKNTEEAQRIRITGSSTIAPVMLEISDAYMRSHPNTRIDIETGGSSRGLADAKMKRSQMGMVSRAKRTEDGSVVFAEIAKDGLAVIVHKSNPLSNISTDQLKSIYRGSVQNWNEVGAKSEQITVVSKADGRSTLEVFLAYTGLKSKEIQPDVIIGDNQQAIKTVESVPSSIGYVSIGSAIVSQEKGARIKLLQLDGVSATPENVGNGHYKLSRSLNIVYSGELDEASKKFLNHLNSSEARAVIRRMSFVPTPQ